MPCSLQSLLLVLESFARCCPNVNRSLGQKAASRVKRMTKHSRNARSDDELPLLLVAVSCFKAAVKLRARAWRAIDLVCSVMERFWLFVDKSSEV
jgi:hypothetical protein